jgi:hypothetical protein
MSCERFREAIGGHAAGGEINAAAAAHLASCESCSARLATQRRLLADVDAELAHTLSLSASPEFVARVTSRVTAPSRSVVWRPAAVWVGLAAAAAIAVAAVLRWPAPAVSPVGPPSASALSVPAPPSMVAETPARASAAARVTVRRSGPPSSRKVLPAPRVEDPVVIVNPDQVRAIARLRELLNAGRLTEKMLPPERPHEAAELTVAPLNIPSITVPDVDAIGHTDAAPRERQ